MTKLTRVLKLVAIPHRFASVGGMGRHSALAIRSADPLLSFAAAVGLAAARRTTLIVDTVVDERAEGRTLADVVEEGPTLAELSPGRTGVALVPAGALGPDQISAAINELARHWPAVVVRSSFKVASLPTVPVVPLYPVSAPLVSLPPVAVWQPIHSWSAPPGPGPVLPRLPGRHLRRILARTLPRKSRWMSAWEPIWEMPWA